MYSKQEMPALDPLHFRDEPVKALLTWVAQTKELPGNGKDYGYRWQTELTAIDGDLQDLRELIEQQDWEGMKWHIMHLLRPTLTTVDRRCRAEQVGRVLHQAIQPELTPSECAA